jgi:hypothetical protein
MTHTGEVGMESARSAGDAVRVVVPAQRGALAQPTAARVRGLRRHLVATLCDLREAKRPDRLIQARAPETDGFAGAVLRASCALCRGKCCRGGGEHAYLDERTMARVRMERPDLDAAAIIRLYVSAVARPGFEGSCLFHGAEGCTLERSLRAELCNSYYCNGLRGFLRTGASTASAAVIANADGNTCKVARVQTHGGPEEEQQEASWAASASGGETEPG